MSAVAAFSGGKDSTALLLWLRDRNIEFRAVFCDTGWEHPLTYAYIEDINQSILGGKLVTLKPDDWVPGGTHENYHDMRDLVARKGRVPSIRARFCTEYLKTNPMRAWLSTVDAPVVYQGIRAEESPARAAMNMSEWSDYYDCQVERPLFRWTAVDVFALLEKHGVAANPLYRLGAGRVGCFPCVLTRHAELRRLGSMLPEVWDRIEELERIAGGSYFPPGFIPDRFCSHRGVTLVTITAEPDSTGLFPLHGQTREVEKAVSWPSVADVRKYLETTTDDLDVYGETPTCLSIYNLCER